MTSKALLYLILYAIIAYGVIYYVFIRPRPSQYQINSTATTPEATVKQANDLPDGMISIALDDKMNVVPEYRAKGHLNIPISKTPTVVCFKGKTFYVSRPTSGVIIDGKLILSGVKVSVSDGCNLTASI